jgi:hypothetical protein
MTAPLGPVEQTLRQQARAQLLKGPLQRAGSLLFHHLGDELQLAARLVQRDSAANPDRQPVLDAKPQHLRVAAEEHDRQLRLAILEREVHMAGRCGAEVRHLALHPKQPGKPILDIAPDGPDQLPDRIGVTRHLARFRHGYRLRNRRFLLGNCGRGQRLSHRRGGNQPRSCRSLPQFGSEKFRKQHILVVTSHPVESTPASGVCYGAGSRRFRVCC